MNYGQALMGGLNLEWCRAIGFHIGLDVIDFGLRTNISAAQTNTRLVVDTFHRLVVKHRSETLSSQLVKWLDTVHQVQQPRSPPVNVCRIQFISENTTCTHTQMHKVLLKETYTSVRGK